MSRKQSPVFLQSTAMSIVKKFSKLKSNIGPLKDGDRALHHKPGNMANSYTSNNDIPAKVIKAYVKA